MADRGAVLVEHDGLAGDLLDGPDDVPDVGVFGDDAQRQAFAGAADPDRWMRTLHRLRVGDRVDQREVSTVERRPLLGPQLPADGQRLVEPADPLAGVVKNGMPSIMCSTSAQPAPSPNSSRPPDRWSTVVAILASTAGWR